MVSQTTSTPLPRTQNKSNNDRLQTQVLSLAKALAIRTTCQIRPEAFKLVCRLASANETLQLMSLLEAPEPDQLVNLKLEYVDKLKLTSLQATSDRYEVLRQLIALMYGKDGKLGDACVNLFDNQNQSSLVDWLWTGDKENTVDVKRTAALSLCRYAERTDLEYLRSLAQVIQAQLVSLVGQTPGKRIAWSYELEYYIQAIGLICKRLGNECLSPSHQALVLILEHRSGLEDESGLATVINAYSEWNSQAERDLNLIREILAEKKEGRTSTRKAAAHYLGLRRDVKSVDLLITIINGKDEAFILRQAAIESIDKICSIEELPMKASSSIQQLLLGLLGPIKIMMNLRLPKLPLKPSAKSQDQIKPPCCLVI